MEDRFSISSVIISLIMIAFALFFDYWIISSFIFFDFPWTFVFYIPMFAFINYLFLYWGIRILIKNFCLIGKKHDENKTA